MIAPSAEVQHGTLSTYTRGCRCEGCRAAWAAYMRVYKAEGPQTPRSRSKSHTVYEILTNRSPALAPVEVLCRVARTRPDLLPGIVSRLRRRHPEWVFHAQGGGYLAVPRAPQ